MRSLKWVTTASLLLTGCTDASVSTEPTSTTVIPAGELCATPQVDRLRVFHRPGAFAVAPGERRTFEIVVAPDLCDSTTVTFTSDDGAVVAAPESQRFEYGTPVVEVTVEGGTTGSAVLTAAFEVRGETVTHEIPVDVLDPGLASCEASDAVVATRLDAGSEVAGSGSLAAATISLPAGADRPNEGSFVWSVSPFDVSLDCGPDTVPVGHEALGPAVTFGPQDRVFPRDIPMSIPINPARLPERARWRDIKVAYQSPAFRAPRVITITDPTLEKEDGQWRLSFRSTRLGTYQAVVEPEAGSRIRRRRLTYRAIVGPSMGGAGAAQIGMRHHHLFDVIAPLGGPLDWTYLIDHLRNNHIAGFRPIAPGTTVDQIQLERAACDVNADCAADEVCLSRTSESLGKCTLLPTPVDPYEHASTFNSWWYEPGEGNGGTFGRKDYVNIFRDLALNFGNPFSYNPEALHLSAGMDPNHPAFTGGRDDDRCVVWLKSYEHPDEDEMRELENSCPQLRCQNTLVLENYYDDEFNPDGSFPVISFCDGGPQIDENSPYANTWTPDAENVVPVDMGLAVDYNGNGKRDEMEPIMRGGTEPWEDVGADGLASVDEPGYGPDNLDPSGDDYDPRFNPMGTEGDHRFQAGEPFEDVGLDGVANTSSSPYDFGEGDGQFTVAFGRQNFWDIDPHSIAREMPSVVSTPFDDEAVQRLDVFADGGINDLFNFYPAAEHFLGGFLGRHRPTAIYTDYTAMPGPPLPGGEQDLDYGSLFHKDMPPVVLHRYGSDDPTPEDIESGSGRHAGTANEVAGRLLNGLYYIGARWDDAPRALVESSSSKPAEDAEDCEIAGNCFFDFTSSFGRTGPVAVSVPPGYAHADLQNLRYPVIYMTHGYGQSPEDLSAIAALYGTLTNNSDDSFETRLPKPIIVYVDGRCRQQTVNGEKIAECYRGSFYADSPRPDGLQNDAWLLELMDYVDQRFRTMREAVVDERY